MRVSIVVGGRFHAFDLAAQLQKRGFLHRLITNYPRFMARRWGIPADRVISLPLSLVASRAISRVAPRTAQHLQYRLSQWFARSAVRHLEGSDLVVGWSSFSEPSIHWARDRGIPCVVERGSAHIVEQDALLREEYQSLAIAWPGIDPRVVDAEVREYELCTQVCVPSRFVERSFHSRGVSGTKLFRNPYGVDLARFRPVSVSPTPPTPDRLKVIYAGALSVRKGTHYLLSAFEYVQRRYWDLTLVGAMAAEVEPWLSKAPSGVRAVGRKPQDELRDWYGQAHCFVMPSIEEGLAMVQAQALSCGLPLICTSNTGGEDLLCINGEVGAARDFGVTEFPAGYVVPIRRPDSIAWCLRQLADDADLWRSKRQAALRLADSSLSWDHYGDRAVAHYESILNRRV